VKKVKIGLVSAIQPSFWGSKKEYYKSYYIPEMKKISERLDFDLVVLEEPLVNCKDSEEAKRKLIDNNIDFLLIQLTTFSSGDIIGPLAETGVKIGLWAIPEITEDGAIPLNSFCGMNMFSSIIGQYIDNNIKYKWFYGDIGDELFINRLIITVKAIGAIKNIKGSKIALIGGIAPGFNDLYFDERKAKAKLGITINRLYEFSDIKDRAISYKDNEVKQIIDEMHEEARCVTADAKSAMSKTARVYKAFEDFIKENDYKSIAISCWPKYRKELGIVVCSIIGRLLDKDYIAACEGDVDSAISMMILKYLAGDTYAPMLMDLSRLDFKTDSILMWHCGSAPSIFADSKGVCLAGHYKPGKKVAGADDIKVGTVGDMYFKNQQATIARLTWEYEKMMVFSGEFIDKGDRSYDGSRGWLSNIKINGESVELKDLVNTIMVQRFQHHYPIVAMNVEKELMEFMSWLDIMPVAIVKYKDYLQNIL
jgi:L-fucose isomerase-like protein